MNGGPYNVDLTVEEFTKIKENNRKKANISELIVLFFGELVGWVSIVYYLIQTGFFLSIIFYYKLKSNQVTPNKKNMLILISMFITISIYSSMVMVRKLSYNSWIFITKLLYANSFSHEDERNVEGSDTNHPLEIDVEGASNGGSESNGNVSGTIGTELPQESHEEEGIIPLLGSNPGQSTPSSTNVDESDVLRQNLRISVLEVTNLILYTLAIMSISLKQNDPMNIMKSAFSLILMYESDQHVANLFLNVMSFDQKCMLYIYQKSEVVLNKMENVKLFSMLIFCVSLVIMFFWFLNQ